MLFQFFFVVVVVLHLVLLELLFIEIEIKLRRDFPFVTLRNPFLDVSSFDPWSFPVRQMLGVSSSLR